MFPKSAVLLLVLIEISIQVDLKIINTSSGTNRPAPCGTICAGESGPNSNLVKFIDRTREYYLVSIDISECGFVEKPIITINLEGKSRKVAEWTHGIYRNKADASRFSVYISNNRDRFQINQDWNVNVMWSAFGYTC